MSEIAIGPRVLGDLLGGSLAPDAVLVAGGALAAGPLAGAWRLVHRFARSGRRR